MKVIAYIKRLARENPAPLVFAAVYVIAATLYVISAGKGPAIMDWGDFVASASVLGIAHPSGYPTYLQLLALPLLALPATWAAAAADVTNALLVAAAPALLALWAFRLGARAHKDAALFAVLLGALAAAAPALWREATSVEVYGLALAFLFAALLLLDAAQRADRRPFVAAALLTGLAAGVHLSAFAFLLLALLLTVLYKRPPLRTLSQAAVALALGLSTILYLPLRAVAAPPLRWSWTAPPDLPALLRHLAARQFTYNFRLPSSLLSRYAFADLGAALWHSAGPLLLLAPLGLFLAWRRSRLLALLLLAVATLNLVFLLVYDIPDIESYRLPFVALTFALAATGALALFAALSRRPFRVVATILATALVVLTVGRGWSHQRRYPAFIAYYSRQIITPLGFRAMFVSGTATSNFLFWFRQYPLGQRPDIELFNINDARFDIDKLATTLWSELDARPVFVDYRFIREAKERPVFAARGRAKGFIVELTNREQAGDESGPLNDEVLAKAAALLAAAALDPDATGRGEGLALSVWENHGFFHEFRGETDNAGYYFFRAAALLPNSAVAQSNLARWYWQKGRADLSARAARAAIRADRRTFSAYAFLAMAARAEGNLDAALRYARTAVALRPHDGKTHRLLASIYLSRGERALAAKEMERTLARGYHEATTILLLARYYREEGRSEDAFGLFQEYAHDTRDARLLNAYALALIERGRYEEAKVELVRGLRVAPNSPEIRASLSRLQAMGW